MGGEYKCPKCGQWQSVGECGYIGDMDTNFGMVDWICAERGELHIDDFMMLTEEQQKEYFEKQRLRSVQQFLSQEEE
jgi:hypothetical protein